MYWGPSTWLFMHTLAAKLKESSFHVVGSHLINVFIQICNNLPCPECSQHSKLFWSKIKTNNIAAKKGTYKNIDSINITTQNIYNTDILLL